MDKRVLVITGTTDILRSESETDATMEEVFDLTLPSKQRYVKKHGYDLMALRSFGADTRNIFSNTHIGHLRFIRSIEMINFYDAVMWIDADSLITNLNYKLEDFMDETTTFVASYDWMHTRTFSTGNFIIQKNNINKLYTTFYDVGQKFNTEQETLNHIYFMLRNQNTHLMKVLDHKYLGSTPTKQQYAAGWEDRAEPIGPWSEDSFLVHLTGATNTNRIRLLKTLYKDLL